MDRFKKWAQREYSKNQRIMAVILGGIVFWIIVPLGMVVTSLYIDHWLNLPKFTYGLINPLIGLIFLITGCLFANWTVKIQFSLGRGTPIPLMATQKLVIERSYNYCRNPMALGTTIFYLGIAIWRGSLSALGLGLIYPIAILLYIKLIEEKELEARFGPEYVEYKRKTPFLIPRFRIKN